MQIICKLLCFATPRFHERGQRMVDDEAGRGKRKAAQNNQLVNGRAVAETALLLNTKVEGLYGAKGGELVYITQCQECTMSRM